MPMNVCINVMNFVHVFEGVTSHQKHQTKYMLRWISKYSQKYPYPYKSTLVKMTSVFCKEGTSSFINSEFNRETKEIKVT